MSKGASSIEGGIQVSPSQADHINKQNIDLKSTMEEVNLNIMISSIDRQLNKKSVASTENSKARLNIAENCSFKDDYYNPQNEFNRVRSGGVIIESASKNNI